MKSKTIIVSAPEENNTRGILTLFQEDELLKCRLRVYNLEKISRYCKLGIYHNNEVSSANLIERNRVYESSFVGEFDIDKDFYVALIDTSKNNEVLLAGGTYQGFYFNDNSVFLSSEDFSNEKHTLNLKTFDECDSECDKCVRCKYKEFFYSHQSEIRPVEEVQASNILKESDVKNDNTQEFEENVMQDEQPVKVFYEEKFKDFSKGIISQFETLFDNYESDDQLNALIENSKFVKISEDGEQFSIGAIYQDDKIKFICYAIKRDYNINPPEELGKNYQWLPLDAEDPLSVGYYVVFQDAVDFKIVEV